MKDTKSPQMAAFLDQMSLSVFGRSRSLSLAADQCVKCGKPATSFTNDRALREYQISATCEACQNEVFGA